MPISLQPNFSIELFTSNKYTTSLKGVNMTTPQEQMRSLIALLESTTVEAQKPTRNSLITRRLDAFLRKNKIDLGPNFSALQADVIGQDQAYIKLLWEGAGDYSKLIITIYLEKSDQPNTAQIALIPIAVDDETDPIWYKEWYNARPASRDKIAQAICGNVGIVPGSIAQASHAVELETEEEDYRFHIAPGSTLANMTKLIPETEEQAEELESIFNKG
jgi:hypothetical protein